MQMVRQDHPRVYSEWPFAPRRPHGVPQPADLADQQVLAALGKCDGKEYGGAGNAGTEIVRHPPNLTGKWLTIRRVRILRTV